MRILSSTPLAVALLFAVPANAQVLDLSTIKCGDFVKSNKDEIGNIVMWLHGYYIGKADGSPVIDFDKFVKSAQALGKYCGENPSVGLITAGDQVLSQ
jgi:acid stress chaperone HdeB